MATNDDPGSGPTLAQRATQTRWLTPVLGLIVGLLAAAIAVTRAARAEGVRLHGALVELQSRTTGLRSVWLVNQRLRRVMEEVDRGS